MSKINPMQAAALKAPIASELKISASTPVSKPIEVKPAVKTSVATPAKKTTAKSAAKKPTKVAAKKTPAVKSPKAEKVPKLKMERDSFTMPKAEYAQLYVLKERLLKLGQPAKKSELLRAGIMQLTAMTDAALKATMGKVPTIKTGRPNKK